MPVVPTPLVPSDRRTAASLKALAGPVTAAVVALLLGTVVSFISALMWGLLVGVVVANVIPSHRLLVEWAVPAKVMLKLGIVLLGFQLSLSAVAAIGLPAVVVIGSTVAATFTATRWLGRRMGLAEDLVTLIAAGFSICGAAAIAGVQEAIGATNRHVGTAVALVTLFGTATMLFVPWAGSSLGLSEDQVAVWAGASIHEVAQVVAASSLIGTAAYPIASAVKLGRVALLAPIAAVVTPRTKGSKVPAVPWFVTGFVVACLIGSTGLVPDLAETVLSRAANGLLAAGMFGLGLGLSIRELAAISRGALALATFATAVALSVPLGLIVLFV